ncbi:MAG: tRNA (adenosine(37)-N6)-dimethylallyltransferase MiaA [Candidatus Saccharibacteria bacterium]|nr:tRNA (adenosine(37)-N6)-dimethylallyltransferase MiaA [Candidatus Saccharibacteria bacterium]
MSKSDSKGGSDFDGLVPVIVGPTGSGKTGAAIEVALACDGEIISADSRAIYKGMDIGTAKPSTEEMRGVSHWGIDLVEPGERFTVADFKDYAEQKICSIQERGEIPIVAGGTGLYVDALVYNYHFGEEVKKSYADRQEMDSRFKVFGIKWEVDELKSRLRQRLNKMFVQELYDETEGLVKKYGWGSQAMKSDIYEYAWKYMQGELTLDEAKEQCFYRDWHLAKRQMTWFKRNEQIIWLSLDEICPTVLKCIQNG